MSAVVRFSIVFFAIRMSNPSLPYPLEQQLQLSQTSRLSSDTMVACGSGKSHSQTAQTALAKNETLKKTMQQWSPKTMATDPYKSMKKDELLRLIAHEEEKSLKCTRFQMLARDLMRKLGQPGSHAVSKKNKKEDFILRLKFLTRPLPSFQTLSVMSALLHDSHLQNQASSAQAVTSFELQTTAVAVSAVSQVPQELMQVDERLRLEETEDDLAALPAGASEANDDLDEAVLFDGYLDAADFFGDAEAEDGDAADLFGDAEAEAHPSDAFDSMTISDEENDQEHCDDVTLAK